MSRRSGGRGSARSGCAAATLGWTPQAFAQPSLTFERVRPTLRASARRVDLDVLLRNGSDPGVTVQVVDIADVAIPPTGRYAVVLRDAVLADAYAAGCHLPDPTRLALDGWRVG